MRLLSMDRAILIISFLIKPCFETADVPLPSGHYLQSNAVLKMKVEIAHPLISPEQLAANDPVPTTSHVSLIWIKGTFWG